MNADSTVSRIDPATGEVVATIDSLAANTIAASGGAVWVATLERTVARIDPRTNSVSATIPVAAAGLNAVAVGAGVVWVTDPLGGSVWRIDPRGLQVVQRTIPVGAGVTGIAYGEGSVWVVNGSDATVSRIDPITNEVTATLDAAATPLAVAAGAGSVWVSAGSASAGRGSTDPSATIGVAGAACADVEYPPEGDPSHIIVSDLPLQGRSQTQTQTIARVIEQVLAERDFRAGEYSIGYQSCDDSTAQAHDFEFERCAANARAYADSPQVLGVIGAYNSDCSLVQLPIAGDAPGGPLPMVSPSNSYAGLTRGPTHPPGELARLYPAGARGYFRVYPADDVQATALATFARKRGIERAFVLQGSNEGGHDPDIAYYFGQAAQRLGITIAGVELWNARAESYTRLAGKIERSGAEGVVLAGSIEYNGGRLIRDLRTVLGPDVVLLGSEGFSRGDDVLAAAGDAAVGMFASTAGTPPERLGPAGRQFIHEFDRTRPPFLTPDYYWAPYAAQATEVMLDAIAASDGTRASVVEQLRATRVQGGVLGDFRFDHNGDITPGAITILRIERGGEGFTGLGDDFAEGTAVEDVIEVGGD